MNMSKKPPSRLQSIRVTRSLCVWARRLQQRHTLSPQASIVSLECRVGFCMWWVEYKVCVEACLSNIYPASTCIADAKNTNRYLHCCRIQGSGKLPSCLHQPTLGATVLRRYGLDISKGARGLHLGLAQPRQVQTCTGNATSFAYIYNCYSLPALKYGKQNVTWVKRALSLKTPCWLLVLMSNQK